MVRHIINIFLYCLPPTRLFRLRCFLLKLADVEIDRTCCFCGHSWVYGRGILSIGEATWISPNAKFYTHVNAQISIGRNCDIGPDVSIIVGSHEQGSARRRAGLGTAKSISIGAGTWIGASVTILNGVQIGDGCVIAAGSVVAADIPNNSLAAGVPAKVKRSFNA